MVVFNLTLVRHGETEFNKDHVIQGQTDTFLSETGRNQAELLGMRLKNEKYTHVFTSDLNRAKETCEILLKPNKHKQYTIQDDVRLRERMFGVYEGKHRAVFLKAARSHQKSMEEFVPTGGESLQQVCDRAVEFFSELCQQILELDDLGEPEDLSLCRPQSIKRRRRNNASLSSNTSLDVFPTSASFCLDSSSASDSSLSPSPEEEPASSSSRDSVGLPSLGNLSCYLDSEHSAHSITTTEGTSRTDGGSASTRGTSSGSTSSGCSSLNTEVAEPLSSSSTLSLSPTATEKESMITTSAADQSNNNNSQLPGTREVVSKDAITNRPASLLIKSNPSSGERTFMQYTSPDACGSQCPNVSLTPAMEHRIDSIPSISSGRNSTCSLDEEGLPFVIADVLIVTHGGVIRAMLQYFLKEYGCIVPGGRPFLPSQSSPNTGLSKFTVTLEEDPLKPRVACVTLYNNDHLITQ